ncbi:MAG: 50S ribosomal protein L13 [bacterium]|nr:50S ribosomal protein L13 [bacterium]
MKSYQAKPSNLTPKWYLVDAENQTLGKLATKVATILRGKHLPTYTPGVNMGDHVVVINAEKIKVTGKKMQDKWYFHHSGYPGGLKVTKLETMLAKKPEMVIHLAVRGMVASGPLGRKCLRRLFVYKGNDHPHQAQKPEIVTVMNKRAS